jgi:hypothetical protein
VLYLCVLPISGLPVPVDGFITAVTDLGVLFVVCYEERLTSGARANVVYSIRDNNRVSATLYVYCCCNTYPAPILENIPIV